MAVEQLHLLEGVLHVHSPVIVVHGDGVSDRLGALALDSSSEEELFTLTNGFF